MNSLRHSFASDGREQPARRRVLFVINSLAGGGAERVMSTLLANSQAWRSRHEIALAVLDNGPRAFAIPDWLKVIQMDCQGGLLSSVTKLDRVVGEFDPDLTVSFLTRANLASGVVMMKRRRPWIISERTSAPAHLGSATRQLATKAMMRAVYPRATGVIAVSDGVARKLQHGSVKPAKIEIIPNPVDADTLKAAARGKNELELHLPYVVAVGRLVSVKNYGLLIEAFAKADLPCRLVIAGEGPERESLHALASRLGVSHRVVMPGWLANPYPTLSAASAFALSSNVEGFPNALVEAMALGVPVVATNCPDGPSEILAGRSARHVSQLTIAEAGVLTPVGNVDDYAQALRTILDESRRANFISAGRSRAADYSAATIAARYWDVIERALGRADAPAAI